MTIEQASFIQALLDRGCTWRMVAELYCDRFGGADTSAVRGYDLARQARALLGKRNVAEVEH